ncbi:Transposable element Hobo transposase, partial [Pseudolycoriella hygida]
TVPESAIHRLNDDIVAGLAKDLRPLSSVERDGFLLMAQSFINFGAKYGQQSAKNVLQHRTILTRNRLPALCASVQEKIKTDLRSAPSYPKFSYTTDMWLEKNDSSHFLSLNAHYISSDWELKKALLGMIQFDDKKTTANIRKECEDILGNINDSSLKELQAFLQPIAEASEILSGDTYPTIHLVALFLLQLEDHIKVKSSDSHEMRALKAQAALCFEEYCEPDEFCCMAAMFDPRYKSLKFAPPETREKAIDMLERLVALELDESMKVAEGTCTLSSKQPQSKKVSRFSKFKDSKNQSEIVSEVEKYRMYPFPDVDDDHIKVKSSDSHEMRALKAQAALCFEEYCEPDEFCYMAAMSDPRYKSLKFAPPETREKAIDMLERLVALELDESMKVAEGTCTLSSKQPQSKKVSRFSKFKDSKNQSEIVSEVEKYRMYPFPDVDDGNICN